jgi:hypothetical protein
MTVKVCCLKTKMLPRCSGTLPSWADKRRGRNEGDWHEEARTTKQSRRNGSSHIHVHGLTEAYHYITSFIAVREFISIAGGE